MKWRILYKHIARVVLLPIPFLPVFYALVFNWQENALHRHMREKLNKQELVTIIAPQHEISWMEYGKELKLPDGRSFDVKYFSGKDGYYILTGLYDDKENVIAKQQQQQGKENTTSNKLPVPLPGVLDVFFEKADLSFISPVLTSNFFIRFSSPLSLQLKTVITPPPKNLFV